MRRDLRFKTFCADQPAVISKTTWRACREFHPLQGDFEPESEALSVEKPPEASVISKLHYRPADAPIDQTKQ